MPQIIKTKPKKSKKVTPKKKTIPRKVAKPKKTSLAVVPSLKSPRTKHSTPDYYNCLLTYANQGWHHPITGEKKRITACCKDCKTNAPALNNQREKELVKLITSYQQVGDSLKKLLKPLN